MLNFKNPPYRKDISSTSGGLLTYVRNDIPSRQLFDFKFPTDIQILAVELNLRKTKWLLLNIYRPPSQSLIYFLSHLADAILYYSRYESVLINSDFNAESDTPDLLNFLNSNQLHNHMKEKTCWKSIHGSCIDLVISNKKYSLMNTGTVETGLSDFHSLIYSMLKATYQKLPPKVIRYRQWKHFNQDNFKFELSRGLQHNRSINNITDYFSFENIFDRTLSKHAPLKTKVLRGNNLPYVNKNLRKAIMCRSNLKKRANLSGKPEDMARFKKQRNFVVNLNRKLKKSFFARTSNSPKNFWKAIKPYFGGKGSAIRERILLVENDSIVSSEKELASVFNFYFNSATGSLNIPPIPGLISTTDNQVTMAILKYRQHPSVARIKSKHKAIQTFDLHKVTEGYRD